MKEDTLKIQCSVYDCLNKAETYFACGIVKGRPKKAFTIKEDRLDRISMKGDVAIPVCKQHKKVLTNYIKNLSK